MQFAKAITSGYVPCGGIGVSDETARVLNEAPVPWMHAYTYSGHPTCCAVALKNLEIMERERLWENAAKMGDRLFAGLQDAFKGHAHVGDIRGGKGLLGAVEMVEDRATKANFAAENEAEIARPPQVDFSRPDTVSPPAQAPANP